MQFKDLFHEINKVKEDFSYKNSNIVTRLNALFRVLKEKVKDEKIETSTLEDICNSLIKIVNLSLSGRRNEAFNLLYTTYFKDDGISRLDIKEYKTGKKSFYRMRNSQEYVQYEKNEMYHIPFDKNYLVGNERFSITGFPTLYLSSSIYGCWEETGRGNLEYANVALFKNTQNIRLISLIAPSSKATVQNNNILLAFPLLLASSLEVVHPKEKFIPEYIVPQLLMECLIEYRNQNVTTDILGIEYKSVHKNKRDLMFNESDKIDIFINYAIPPFDYKSEGGICPKLMEIFEYWNSVSWAKLQYQRPNAFINIVENGQKRYSVSRFGLMEKYLNMRDPKMLTYHSSIIGGITGGALTY